MKIEKGKYVRLPSGIIRQQSKTHNYPDYLTFKVANTPQELIEDKDILQFRLTLNNETWETMLSQCDDYEIELTQLEEEFDNVEVIKILTPNGKDYICQWESELND